MDIVYDNGISLNPKIDIGQIEGGLVMSMGWHLTEEIISDGTTGVMKSNGTWGAYCSCLFAAEPSLPACLSLPDSDSHSISPSLPPSLPPSLTHSLTHSLTLALLPRSLSLGLDFFLSQTTTHRRARTFRSSSTSTCCQTSQMLLASCLLNLLGSHR